MAKGRKMLSFAVLLVLLLGFPLVSFIYLKQGADYRRAAIATKQDFGSMPSLTYLPALRGQLPDTLRGKMTVVGWLDPTKEEGTRMYGMMLDSLYQQFRNSPNLHFTTITLAKEPERAARAFAEEYNLPNDRILSFLRADEREFQRTAEQFSLPLGQYDGPGVQPVVALVDSSLTVVKHYDLARRDQAVGLVQMVALIIPLPERQDLIYAPQKEL